MLSQMKAKKETKEMQRNWKFWRKRQASNGNGRLHPKKKIIKSYQQTHSILTEYSYSP